MPFPRVLQHLPFSLFTTVSGWRAFSGQAVPSPQGRVNRSRARLSAVGLAVGAWVMLASLPAQAAESLSIGYQKGSGVLSVIKAQGNFAKQLKAQGIDVSWHEFPAGPQLLEALNAGAVDVGYTGAPPPVFAQAAGIDLRYVAAVKSPDTTQAIVVSKGSAIHSVAALKGKRVAVQKGSSAHHLLVVALKRAGLTINDIQPVYLAPADARAAFAGENVDAWAVWDPYLTSAEHDLSAQVLANYKGLPNPYSFYEASTAFTQQHPRVLKELLTALGKTSLWVNQHPAEVSQILARELGISVDVISEWQHKLDYRLLPLDKKVIESQQQVADVFSSEHLIPAPVDVSKDFLNTGKGASAVSE